jgi:2-alkyl-3-oxoalkanoate reductase
VSFISPNGPVLVTGGTGFLGRRLVERLLAQGRTVTILARTPAPDLAARGVRFVCTPLDDMPAVRAACAGVDTIFHVAAKVGVWGRHDDFFRANVLGTRALLAGARAHGALRFVHTSTPSVVYNGAPLAGADESLPLTTRCPSAYPLTKAIAEREVLAADAPALRTIALRPHLIWGVGDPHLVPRVLARARAGRLRIVGDGRNRVDLVHVENAVDAHLLAEAALASPATPAAPPAIAHAPTASSVRASASATTHTLSSASASTPASASPSTPSAKCHLINDTLHRVPGPGGRAYFITNGEPVVLWEWINGLLAALGEPAITKRLPLGVATVLGACCEATWRTLPLRGEPPMTRFVAAELAKDHWFDIAAARRDLGYAPRISMAAGTAELVASLRAAGKR